MLQVLIVDMLEGFTRSGPLASPRVAALLAEQAAFLRALPDDSFVVFACDAHEPDDVEFRRFPPHCLAGSPEADICSELTAVVKDRGLAHMIVRKRQFSAFVETDLGEFVAERDNKDWIVIGCVTDCCIEANVAELVYRGCNVTVIRNLVDTWDMTAEQANSANLPTTHVHVADAINRHWFEQRLPAIWGTRVVADWRELVE